MLWEQLLSGNRGRSKERVPCEPSSPPVPPCTLQQEPSAGAAQGLGWATWSSIQQPHNTILSPQSPGCWGGTPHPTRVGLVAGGGQCPC